MKRIVAMMALLLAVLFVCSVAIAAEVKPVEKSAKPVEKPAKPATKPVAKPVTTPVAEKPAAEAADKKAEAKPAGEEGEEVELTPLEKQLSILQTALEKASAENRNRIPINVQGLYPYLKGKDKAFINPETQKNLLINEEIYGKAESQILKPAEFVTFYADEPTPDKGRAVMFADGTIKYLDEEAFKKALSASKIAKPTREEAADAAEERRERQRARGK